MMEEKIKDLILALSSANNVVPPALEFWPWLPPDYREGEYDYVNGIIRLSLMDSGSIVTTAIHEFLHHFDRTLPEGLVEKIAEKVSKMLGEKV